MRKRGLPLLLAVMACMVLLTVPAAAEQKITHGEFAQIIVDKMTLSGDISGVEKPQDLSEDHPYYHAIMLCKKYDFLSARSYIFPDYFVDRSGAAEYLMKMAEFIGMTPPEGTPPKFSDEIFYTSQLCCQYGMMSGYSDGTFRPHEDVLSSDINWKPLDDAITALQPTNKPVELDLSLGSITISEGLSGGSVYQQGDAKIISIGPCIIWQSNADTPTENTIAVTGGTHQIKISNLNINTLRFHDGALQLENRADLTLILEGENKLLNKIGENGIAVPYGTALTIRGTGSLYAEGGSVGGVGIGGVGDRTEQYDGDCGAITINRGTITAVGGKNGAGIGSAVSSEAQSANLGRITINGGTVVATGGDYGAGIGGSWKRTSGCITINGGHVTAKGGAMGAGIGAGHFARTRSDRETITISGGTVIAEGGQDAAGIGGGNLGETAPITISAGTVTARGRDGGAGIGSVTETIGSSITISGGDITATGGNAGIGGGYDGTTVISGGTVYASGRVTGIGAGDGDYGSVLIKNAKLTAEGGLHAIGGGSVNAVYGSIREVHGCSSIVIEKSAELQLSHTDSKGADCQEMITGLELAITEAAALERHPAGFPVEVESHSGIRAYQWQTSPDNKDDSVWTDVEGQTAATLSIPVTKENENHFYRCRVTNKYGNTTQTDAVCLKLLQITLQPASVVAEPDDGALFKVDSSALYAAYAWQKSIDNGAHWTPAENGTKKTLAVNTPLSDNSTLYRCRVSVPNGDFVFSDFAKLTVQSNDPTYTVKYYLENPDGTYGAFDQFLEEQPAGTAVTAPEKTFDHYTENISMGTHSGTVAKDSTLVLSRYYDRNSYTIHFNTSGGTQLPDLSEKFGREIPLPEPSRMGCTFGGWFTDTDCTQKAELTVMPAQNMTLCAKWNVIGAGRSDDEYTINGITLRDGSYQLIASGIPRGTFFAEVGITNHASVTMDTVLLASYNKDGQMLGLTFLYANPQPGQTFVLGSMFDNSRGEIAELRAFTLPMLGGLVPLSNSVTYPTK